MKKIKTVAIYTLGCKVNQYESESIAGKLSGMGYKIVGPKEKADAYLINSCTVTDTADKKTRNFIRRTKRINPDALTIVTGCYAELESEKIKALPEVDAVAGLSDKEKIPELLFGAGGQHQNRSAVTNLRTRVWLKIEDGCDRFCSYCIVPHARGPVKSKPLDDVMREAGELISYGYKELVLTGINAALYGSDFSYKSKGIIEAIDKISEIPGDYRIRLGSLEPTVIDAAYTKELIKRERLCPHLHLSLQSGSDRILTDMGRNYTMDDFIRIADVLKRFDPDYSITTDIIAGFPGETEDDFRHSLRAVETIGFSRVHVFRYSPRKGTKAAEMTHQVAETEKRRRSGELKEAADLASEKFIRQNKGKKRQSLVLNKEVSGRLTALTDNDITLSITNSEKQSEKLINSFVDAEI